MLCTTEALWMYTKSQAVPGIQGSKADSIFTVKIIFIAEKLTLRTEKLTPGAGVPILTAGVLDLGISKISLCRGSLHLTDKNQVS